MAESIRERARLAHLQAIAAHEQDQAARLDGARADARAAAASTLSAALARMQIHDEPVDPAALRTIDPDFTDVHPCGYWFPVEDLAFSPTPTTTAAKGHVRVALPCRTCRRLVILTWGAVANLIELALVLEAAPPECATCHRAAHKANYANTDLSEAF